MKSKSFATALCGCVYTWWKIKLGLRNLLTSPSPCKTYFPLGLKNGIVARWWHSRLFIKSDFYPDVGGINDIHFVLRFISNSAAPSLAEPLYKMKKITIYQIFIQIVLPIENSTHIVCEVHFTLKPYLKWIKYSGK